MSSRASPRSAPTRAAWWRRALLALGTTACSLLVVEVGVRVVARLGESRRQEAWFVLAQGHRLAPGTEATLAHLIRPVRNPRRVYELIPGLEVRFQQQPVCTDERGRRVHAAAAAEPAAGKRVVRIVGIGDSVMFGWGVAEGDGFLRQLERLLREQHPEVDWQTVNTGVPGYNTTMEVETLKDTALSPAPQLVLLDFVDNDLDLPNFLAHRTDYWDPSTSFLLEWIESVRRGFDTQAFRPFELAPKRGEGLFVGDPAKVPEPYRDMVGEAGLRRALGDLDALARQHGFEWMATTHATFLPVMRQALQAVGAMGVETGPVVAAHMQQHGIAEYRGNLTVRADDPHPNATVHRLHAETIHRALVERGIVARLLHTK